MRRISNETTYFKVTRSRGAGRDTEYETYLIVNKISVMQFKAWNVADGERDRVRGRERRAERNRKTN